MSNQVSAEAKIRSDKESLKRFLENFSRGRWLSHDQAKSNLYQGVVEIVYPDMSHCANGILVTKHGYFLTNYHCVDHLDKYALKVRTHDGRTYPIKKICGFNAKDDVALAVADIPAPSEPVVYRFVNDSELRKSRSLEMYVRWYGDLKKKRGIATDNGLRDLSDNINLQNQILIKMTARHGDSGGIVVTPDYELYALVTSVRKVSLKNIPKEILPELSVTTCTFLFSALKIIEKVIGGGYSMGVIERRTRLARK